MRHGAVPEQSRFLEKIYGEKMVYNYLESDRLELNDIIKCINRFQPNEIIAVLPIDMIIALMKRGIFPLHSIMENVNDPQNCDVVYDGFKCRNFKRFRRYQDVKTYYFPSLEGKFVMNPTLGFKPTSDRILLFSYKRSSVSTKEKKFLEQFYGKKLTFIYKGKDTDVAALAQQIKSGDYLDLIIEAPKSVLIKITDLGVNPLIANNKKVLDDSTYDIKFVNGTKYEFLDYKRLQRLYVEYSDPVKINLYGMSRANKAPQSKIRTFN